MNTEGRGKNSSPRTIIRVRLKPEFRATGISEIGLLRAVGTGIYPALAAPFFGGISRIDLA